MFSEHFHLNSLSPDVLTLEAGVEAARAEDEDIVTGVPDPLEDAVMQPGVMALGQDVHLPVPLLQLDLDKGGQLRAPRL